MTENENMKNSDATYKTEFKWIKLFNGIRALLKRWKDSLIEKDDVVNYGLQLRWKVVKNSYSTMSCVLRWFSVFLIWINLNEIQKWNPK